MKIYKKGREITVPMKLAKERKINKKMKIYKKGREITVPMKLAKERKLNKKMKTEKIVWGACFPVDIKAYYIMSIDLELIICGVCIPVDIKN